MLLDSESVVLRWFKVPSPIPAKHIASGVRKGGVIWLAVERKYEQLSPESQTVPLTYSPQLLSLSWEGATCAPCWELGTEAPGTGEMCFTASQYMVFLIVLCIVRCEFFGFVFIEWLLSGQERALWSVCAPIPPDVENTEQVQSGMAMDLHWKLTFLIAICSRNHSRRKQTGNNKHWALSHFVIWPHSESNHHLPTRNSNFHEISISNKSI